jgi:hypothetical protein
MPELPPADIGLDAFVRDSAPEIALSRMLRMIETHAQGILDFHGIRPSNFSPDIPREAHCALSALSHARALRAAITAENITDAVSHAMAMMAAAEEMYKEVFSGRLRRLAELGSQQTENLARGSLKDYETEADRKRLWEGWKQQFDKDRADNPNLSMRAACQNIAKRSALAGKKNVKTGKPYSARTVQRAIESLSRSENRL